MEPYASPVDTFGVTDVALDEAVAGVAGHGGGIGAGTPRR
ncbi:hypothetical protein SANTM175S_00656 [Streptomyces antimycoticus]